jgi:hypothetical protein
MAGAASPNPMSDDFDFHSINEHAQYRGLFLCSPEDRDNRLEIGGLLKHPQDFRYEVDFNGGRLGTPGLEILIEHVPTNLGASVFFEPGVAEGSRYHLHSFKTEWLGRPGGGGHMYDQDPRSVGAASLDIKKRTLKVRIHIYGQVSPDPSAIGALYRALPAGSAERRFIASLTTPSDNGLAIWIYCVVPVEAMTVLEARSLAYLRHAVANRVPPYYQYTHPQNVINLSMLPLPGFRRNMYCRISSTGPQTRYGPATFELMDTRGRRAPRPVAQVNQVGLIRDWQRYQAFCTKIRGSLQSLKLVRTSWPVLGAATRAFGAITGRPAVPEPTDKTLLLGLINVVRTKERFPIKSPYPGAIALLAWHGKRADGRLAPTGEVAMGMVLQVAQSDLNAVGAKVVFGLWTQSQSLKRHAVRGVANAVPEWVEVRFITNTKLPEAQLHALEAFSKQITVPAITSLHANVLFSPSPIPQTPKDLRHGPSASENDPNELNNCETRFANAVQDLRSLPQMANLSQSELQFLTQVPAEISGFYRLVRASVARESFRAVLGLALTLTNTRPQTASGKKSTHQTILVIDNVEDRSKICYDIHRLLKGMVAKGRNGGELWKGKKILSWSAVDIEHHFTPPPRDQTALRNDLENVIHPFREQFELFCKFIYSDLPEHSIALDQTGTYIRAPFNDPPANHTPLGMSMGDAKQDYFVRHPQEAHQYYLDRANMINHAPGNIDAIHEMQRRCHIVDRNVLGEADILITDPATAMSEDAKAAFPTPIIMYMNGQAALFPEAAGVLMAYPKMEAAFVIGDTTDNRHPPQVASGEGRNEAWKTYGRPIWTMMANTRADCFLL